MEQEKGNNLFDVRLNQQGILAIKKFARIVKWIMALVIIVSFILLVEAFINYSLTSGKIFRGSKPVFYLNRVYLVYIVIYLILVFYQTYNLLTTGRHLSAAIDNNDEESFNRSFLHLYKSAIFSVVALLLYLLMSAFRFFVLLESFYNK